ncbi:aminotransferase class V-fold PLP-dependent enzyme [Pseudomonas sp. N040]|uniref:aminotransferase class V-fold PLP-dependent enzyme n=1 Tax=Pseudomonas sp. N040 TaxID=2785325 RepID=UPI0018A27D20|nr:cysteine desulfurase [Pseudomonas sp. N040]MBF7729693.1 cysteine desulfurase [Pseudomonas sp. N040]MBW7013335.1 cysteine desulfurase [Pseudomonas sp. N040]
MALISPWRADFPGILALEAEAQTYLDSAATAQKPQAVLERLTDYYAHGAANVHRAQHLPGERATRAFEAVREQLAGWLNAADSREIIFTRGTTEAVNLLAYGLESQFQPGDEIVITALEHHANLLPWQQLAQRRRLKLVVLPLDASGDPDLAAARALIGPRTRLLAVSQLSNVLGRWTPLAALLQLARQHGALTVVDGAQGAVHARPDVQALDCDFYACSAHKLYSAEGVGVLYARQSAAKRLSHWQFGGEMVLDADFQQARFRPAPLGFEAGTPAIGAVLALGAALDYLQQLDSAAVQAHEGALHACLLDGLRQRPGLRLLGAPQLALASFSVEGMHGSDLAHLLSEQGVCLRNGHHCAMPLLKQLGLSGALRVSLGLYNDGADLQRFFAALDQAMELLQ